ncbi:MAG: DUF3387 domain-containing protein [Magnetococcus sp. YQC-5]
MPKMVEMPMQIRSANFVSGTANAEARTVDMIWSTGATVRRRDWVTGQSYDETLSMNPSCVDLSRLNGGAPLLDSHDASALDSILGVVERAWIEGGMGRATVRFSSREDVAPIFKDVQDGILRNVSVGYTVRKYELTEEAGKVPHWRAVEWTPLELSAVPLGADPGAGFRAQENSTNPCQMIYIRGAATMADIAPPKDEVAPAEPITQARAIEPVPQARAIEPVPQARATEPIIIRYHTNALSTVEVLQELIQLAKDIRAARQRGEEEGLSEDEIAFYDALAENESAVQVMGSNMLKVIAHELLKNLQQNATVDWSHRESARARMRVLVKRILRKYGYPPDLQDVAVQTVLQQAEALSAKWATV